MQRKQTFGSGDSLDVDIMVILNEVPPTRDTCKIMCLEYDRLFSLHEDESEPVSNHNLCTVKNGMVDWVYKGTIDEVNNSMLDTFELHNQYDYGNVITKRMERDPFLKAVRGLRIILSFFSRGVRRKEVKAALKGGIDDKIKCLEMITPLIPHYDLNKKGTTKIEAYKTIAFQIGQIYGLYTDLELYTKQDIGKVFPTLAPYLRREEVCTGHLVESLGVLVKTLSSCVVLREFQDCYVSDSNENFYDEFKLYIDGSPLGTDSFKLEPKANSMILSPPLITENPDNKPTVFLAGPIQGAVDWQAEAGKLFEFITQKDELRIANPRKEYLDKEFDYAAQVDWEIDHLRKASVNGVLLFWLAREEEHDCHRAYAQTTRWELAVWFQKMILQHYKANGTYIHMVVGIEEGFTGERYIRKQFADNSDFHNVVIQSTLKDTVIEAVKILSK